MISNYISVTYDAICEAVKQDKEQFYDSSSAYAHLYIQRHIKWNQWDCLIGWLNNSYKYVKQ